MNIEKQTATACARAVLAGVHAVPSHDDRGYPTVILTAGPLTREVQLSEFEEALPDFLAQCSFGRVPRSEREAAPA